MRTGPASRVLPHGNSVYRRLAQQKLPWHADCNCGRLRLYLYGFLTAACRSRRFDQPVLLGTPKTDHEIF